MYRRLLINKSLLAALYWYNFFIKNKFKNTRKIHSERESLESKQICLEFPSMIPSQFQAAGSLGIGLESKQPWLRSGGRSRSFESVAYYLRIKLIQILSTVNTTCLLKWFRRRELFSCDGLLPFPKSLLCITCHKESSHHTSHRILLVRVVVSSSSIQNRYPESTFHRTVVSNVSAEALLLFSCSSNQLSRMSSQFSPCVHWCRIWRL